MTTCSGSDVVPVPGAWPAEAIDGYKRMPRHTGATDDFKCAFMENSEIRWMNGSASDADCLNQSAPRQNCLFSRSKPDFGTGGSAAAPSVGDRRSEAVG